MDKEKMMATAMQIIAYAGSAFDYFNRAIEAMEHDDPDDAKSCMEKGRAELCNAHNTQTELLTAEAGGEDLAFSILMVHAQDHLTMAIFSERMAKHFIALWNKERSN